MGITGASFFIVLFVISYFVGRWLHVKDAERSASK
jgi:hypothetical protein